MNLLLDMARGIAALLVFLFHVRGGLEASMPVLADIVRFGSLGVPLFFVISGYVISASAEATLRKGESAGAFLKRRFLRIFPPFWLSILVVLAVPYLLAAVSALKSGMYEMPEPRFLALGAIDWVQLVSLVKVFMAVGDDLQGQFNQVNAVYWTLAIEFQFYLCVYLALLFRAHFRLIIALVSGASLLLLAWPLPLNSGLFIHFWPMFAVGIALQYLSLNGWQAARIFSGKSRIVAALGVVLILGTLLQLAYLGSLEKVLERLFPSAGLGFALICALVLWLAAPFGEGLEAARKGGNRALRWLLKPAAYLGVISYSVYLLHGIIVQVPGMIVRQVLPASNPLNPLLSVAGTLVLCGVFYTWAEKPFMSKRQRAINATLLEDERDSAAGQGRPQLQPRNIR